MSRLLPNSKHLGAIPSLVLLHIFRFMDSDSRKSAILVSSKWKQIILEDPRQFAYLAIKCTNSDLKIGRGCDFEAIK